LEKSDPPRSLSHATETQSEIAHTMRGAARRTPLLKKFISG